MTDPLIVPLKILRGHDVQEGLGVLQIKWVNKQPWLVSAGADGSVSLWCSWRSALCLSFDYERIPLLSSNPRNSLTVNLSMTDVCIKPPPWYVARTGHSARVSLTSDIGTVCGSMSIFFMTYLSFRISGRISNIHRVWELLVRINRVTRHHLVKNHQFIICYCY
jgi:hypothetical protein